MPIHEVEALNLRKLEMRSINLEEALLRLLEGEILVVKGYEKSRGKDVLVRLDRRKYDVTEVSFNTNPLGEYQPVWQPHPVEINTLSLKEVYPYNADVYLLNPKYGIGQVVRYTPDLNEIASIQDVYVSDAGVLYSLNNREGYYSEEELVDYIM